MCSYREISDRQGMNKNLSVGVYVQWLFCIIYLTSFLVKALHDLEEVIGPPLAHRRKQRESVGVSFYDVCELFAFSYYKIHTFMSNNICCNGN